jgi:hypothetical protein
MRTRLPGKKKANNQPSDRMLRATNEQQSRLKELLAQRSRIEEDILVEDDDAPGAEVEAATPAPKKPRKKAAPSKATKTKSDAPAATTTRKKKSTTATPQVNVAVVNTATDAPIPPATSLPEPTTAEAPMAERKAMLDNDQEPIRIHRETVAASPLDIRDDATEDFWRARIAEEIRQQRDKVQRFYTRRGTMNEEQERNLKIFELSEAIALGQDIAPATVQAAEVRPEQSPTPHVPEVVQTEVLEALEVRQAPEVAQPIVLDMTTEIPVVTASILPAVEQAPSLPPLNSGEILVLVGDAHEAYQQACAIIKECERPETHVFAVAPSSVTLPLLRAEEHFGHADAYQLVDVVTELDVPAIVVVHAPLSMLLNEAEKVRVLQAVTSLNSGNVWAVVDAAWRTESLRRWVRSLEGVTALVVTNEAQCADPEALTAIGIPGALRNERTRSAPSRKSKAPANVPQVGSLPV